jgi:hypothetical protein
LTTLRQIKNLVAPLLERHADLALIGPFLVMRPVHHFAHTIAINRSSSADVFEPQTASVSLLTKRDHFGLGIGFFFRGRTGFLWRWSACETEEDFVRIAESEALPQLRSIQSLQDYYTFVKELRDIHFPFYWGWRAAMKVAMNQLDEAREILNDSRWKKDSGAIFNREVEGLGDRLKARGSDLSRKDKLALVEILHRWEAYSVEKLKLTAIWERTPFPLEENL